MGVFVSVSAGAGVSVAGAGVGVSICSGSAVMSTGGGAVGARPKMVMGTRIVIPARSTPPVRQLTLRNSSTVAWERAEIWLSVSPGRTIYSIQFGGCTR